MQVVNTEKRWVLMNGYRFVGVDEGSGGYPYDTDFWNCRKFLAFEDACSYSATMKSHYKLIEVIGYFGSEIERMDTYELELAALKKKHGRA